jgi:cell volume regulation protein A
VIQGTTLSQIARFLHLTEEPKAIKGLKNFDVEFSDEIKSITSELKITQQALNKGNHLMDLRIPEKTIVVMVKRGGLFFVPNGKTQLMENDKLLVITDDYQALSETYERLGIT